MTAARTCGWCGEDLRTGVDPRTRFCSLRCRSKQAALDAGKRVTGPDGDGKSGAQIAELLTIVSREVPWGDDRPCRGVPADTFFTAPIRGANRDDYLRSVARAKLVCAPCPYRDGCADYATANRIEHGIWGGLTPEERRRAARRRSA